MLIVPVKFEANLKMCAELRIKKSLYDKKYKRAAVILENGFTFNKS